MLEWLLNVTLAQPIPVCIFFFKEHHIKHITSANGMKQLKKISSRVEGEKKHFILHTVTLALKRIIQ